MMILRFVSLGRDDLGADILRRSGPLWAVRYDEGFVVLVN